MPKRAKWLAALLCVTLAAPGCSIVLTHRVPSNQPPDEYPDCTSSLAPSVADAIFAVLYSVGGVALLTANENANNDGKSFGTMGLVGVALAVVHLGSAGYGAWQRGRCVAAKQRTPLPDRNHYQIDTPGAGSLGGPCEEDGTCEGALECDPTMRVCIAPDADDGA